jgi:hypothetical protein
MNDDRILILKNIADEKIFQRADLDRKRLARISDPLGNGPWFGGHRGGRR